MRGRLLPLAIPLLVLTAALAGACDGGIDSPTPTDDAADGTPTPFEEVRGDLSEQLVRYRANIDALPPDVRDQLLNPCRGLEAFVSSEDVDEICGAIEDAIEQGDPGRIDLVLARLAELEPN